MSSGFISENEIAERRKIRQEEWEKVRQPDQPLEVPEEEYDHRSLFDRLQEQKQRKEFEFEEAHRLKNMIKGLDDDEIDFLDLVDRSKLEEERRKTLEEAREMADFRNKVASLQEQSLEQRIQLEIKSKPPPSSNRSQLMATRKEEEERFVNLHSAKFRSKNPVDHRLISKATKSKKSKSATSIELNGKPSQTKLLAGAVVKKRPAEPTVSPPKKQKVTEESENAQSVEPMKNTEEKPEGKRQRAESGEVKDGTSLQCIGILPGLTSYEDSSDSASSDLDLEPTHKFDLLGRKVCRKSGTVSSAQ